MDLDTYRCSTIVNKRLNIFMILLLLFISTSIVLNIIFYKKLENATYQASAKYFYRTVKILEQLNNAQIDENTGNVLSYLNINN